MEIVRKKKLKKLEMMKNFSENKVELNKKIISNPQKEKLFQQKKVC